MAPNEVTYDPTLMDSLDEDFTALTPEFDRDADYAAPPPPLPDGPYRVALSCAGVKDENGQLVPFRKRPWGNIPSTFHTSIQGRVIDPGGPQDGKYVTDNTVTTHIDPRRHNTSKVAMYYRAITGKPIPGVSEGQHMKALLELLQGNPVVLATTQLEGQAQDAGKAFSDAKKSGTLEPGQKSPKNFRGQRAFHFAGFDENDNPINSERMTGVAYDPETKERVVGRPVIVSVKPA